MVYAVTALWRKMGGGVSLRCSVSYRRPDQYAFILRLISRLRLVEGEPPGQAESRIDTGLSG